MKPLEVLQREFFDALQFPLRGSSRESTELVPNDEGHAPEFLEKARELMKPGSNLSSEERLELYHRQYWFRVLDSIAEDFPVLRKMAGEAQFWNLMEAYLSACPSGSFTLRHLGRRMDEFVSSWDGLDVVERRWFSSIAKLEYAYMEIFEAADFETVPPDQLATAELILQPHVFLLELPVPADLCEDWETFTPNDDPPVWVAVWRGETRGRLQCRLDDVEFELLLRLRNGGKLDALFSEPASREPEPEEISRWFTNWQSRGWIAVAPKGDVVDFPPVAHRSLADLDWTGVDKMGSQAMAMEE
ncbi:MAG TPA: DNA-binding domain-containing protein [Luteolibacter sp.]|nr:DNA-binding domain-containing protein [Luteolibacter sp.]